MNIFDFAIQMEKDGENYYRSAAQNTANPGLKSILTMLADDEVHHGKIMLALKGYQKADLASPAILRNAKNVFLEMKETNDWNNIATDQVEVYKKAQEIEVKSFTFYVDKSKEIDETSQKKVFLIVAEEEKRHYFLLDNIIKFITRPQTWLENAEFNHLDNY